MSYQPCIEDIEKLDWRKAIGVKNRGQSNPALAPRDYDIPCRIESYLIALVQGYYVWWCVNHAQPLFHCEAARAKSEQETQIGT